MQRTPVESTPSLRGGQCPSVDSLCQVAEAGVSEPTKWILRHAETCAECRRVLSVSVAEPDEEEKDIGYTLAPGEILASRYKILRCIGHGGMGEVYEAFDVELDERVALKTLTVTRLDSAAAISRFKQEIKLARRVTHASVCKLFEFGFHNRPGRRGPEVVPFITMEFIEGKPLNEATRAKFTFGECKLLLLQLLDGLAALHDTGVVHRDLKPHNVLLVPQSSGPARVVLIDFGLARITSARAGTLSGANVFAGSF